MATPGKSIDQALIADVVREVLDKIQHGSLAPRSLSSQHASGQLGVFSSVDEAVAAASRAQKQLADLPMSEREKIIEAIRTVMRRDKHDLGKIEFEETKIGRLEHKVSKLEVAAGVPGIEMLRTDATSGDRGLTVTEYVPFGVVGIVTPVTHSVPTVGCNAIMILSAGNALVCNPHPGGAGSAIEATRRWNREIVKLTGIDNLICIIQQPTIETAQQIFTHEDIRLLLVTGGPGVAKAAMNSGKRAIAAGPGNPPVVVDETADIDKAAAGIITGAAFDNNLLCIGEKMVFVVKSVFDDLLKAMSRHGGYRLTGEQLNQLTNLVLYQDKQSGHWHPKKEFLGRDASFIASAIGLRVSDKTQLLYGPADLQSPLLPCEQMMPLLPIVPVSDVDEGIQHAIHFEHGFKHTACMWSRNVDNLTKMGKACDATIFVKNGASAAGLGLGGEGYCSFSIATPTGEGVTTPLHFTRHRRCVMVDSLRIF